MTDYKYIKSDYGDMIEDIKKMNEHDLDLLAYELRSFLIDHVSKTGGHLASNLGVVELSIAMHYVFDSPNDKFIWDVGHQSYVHKIITGRGNGFKTLRQFEGMSGFPKKQESNHDFLDSGHSSNSISFALGMAEARDLKNEDHHIVSVIGDGALTGGMAYEALNNAGHSKTKTIVILNDNEMSIGENTGGITTHLERLRTAKSYLEFKKKIKRTLKKVPGVGNNIYSGFKKIKDVVKYSLLSGVIFEELGFTYLGPIDGHSIHDLTYVLNRAKEVDGPVFIHILTKKGKGLKMAEESPDLYHGVGPFNPSTGSITQKASHTYSDIVGDTLVSMAKEDDQVVAITAAMCSGTGLAKFCKAYPDRFFDVGIAEQHAVTFAAGLAQNGLKPFVPIYSTFLQRAYDQIMMDICLQNLPVTLCIDRGGIVGSDGETHHGIYDLSYLRHMPNIHIYAPKDQIDLENILKLCKDANYPCAIRYPRGNAPQLQVENQNYDATNAIDVLAEGTDLCLIATGRMVEKAVKVASSLEEYSIKTQIINIRRIKPLDEKTLYGKIEKITKLITIEDNTLIGGLGDMIGDLLHKNSLNTHELVKLGWPDQFVEHGSIDQLDQKHGLSIDAITQVCKKLYES